MVIQGLDGNSSSVFTELFLQKERDELRKRHEWVLISSLSNGA